MKVFYTPATADTYPNIIDTVVEIEGAQIGQFSRETLEQIQKRYPGAQVGEASEVAEQREAMMISEPQRITEEQFNDALECLPPEGWVRHQHTESFKLCEYYSGRITSIYARFGTTYWTFKDIGSKSHVEIMDKVSKAATHVVHGRRFTIVAEFPETEEGIKEANQFMEANRDTGLLALENGRAIIAKLADKGVPA